LNNASTAMPLLANLVVVPALVEGVPCEVCVSASSNVGNCVGVEASRVVVAVVGGKVSPPSSSSSLVPSSSLGTGLIAGLFVVPGLLPGVAVVAPGTESPLGVSVGAGKIVGSPSLLQTKIMSHGHH
jgi:hypothetical protein